jgi:DNA-binding transcriptional ArsR family regulator
VLRQVGLVSVRQVGRERLYRLSAAALKEVSDWVGHYERFWRERLEILGDELEKDP